MRRKFRGHPFGLSPWSAKPSPCNCPINFRGSSQMAPSRCIYRLGLCQTSRVGTSLIRHPSAASRPQFAGNIRSTCRQLRILRPRRPGLRRGEAVAPDHLDSPIGSDGMRCNQGPKDRKSVCGTDRTRIGNISARTESLRLLSRSSALHMVLCTCPLPV